VQENLCTHCEQCANEYYMVSSIHYVQMANIDLLISQTYNSTITLYNYIYPINFIYLFLFIASIIHKRISSII